MVVKKDQKQKRKEQIIESAARVFSRRGFSNTVMTDIATEAQIGKGTIYEYFKSKEDLFFAVFEWFSKTSTDASIAHITTMRGTTAQRLYSLNNALMKSWFEMKDLYALVMEFWSASSSSAMRERFKEAFRLAYIDYRQMVASLIRDGIDHHEFQSDVYPESIAASLVGTWDALLLQAWFDDSFDPILISNHYIRILIRGMKSPGDLTTGETKTC